MQDEVAYVLEVGGRGEARVGAEGDDLAVRDIEEVGGRKNLVGEEVGGIVGFLQAGIGERGVHCWWLFLC